MKLQGIFDRGIGNNGVSCTVEVKRGELSLVAVSAANVVKGVETYSYLRGVTTPYDKLNWNLKSTDELPYRPCRYIADKKVPNYGKLYTTFFVDTPTVDFDYYNFVFEYNYHDFKNDMTFIHSSNKSWEWKKDMQEHYHWCSNQDRIFIHLTKIQYWIILLQKLFYS